MADSFEDLLENAQKLTADMGRAGDMPLVQRNIAQIAAAGQRLWDKAGSSKTETADVRASILLGSRGFDVPRLSQKLDRLDAAKTFEPLAPVRDTDIQGFLKNERENAVLTVIEESRKKTFKQAEEHHWRCVQTEWEEEKQQILNSLLGMGQDTLVLPAEYETVSARPLAHHGRSGLDAVEMSYARQVYIHNEKKMNDLPHVLVHAFRNASEKFSDQEIYDCWCLLGEMVAVPNLPSDPVAARTSDHVLMSFISESRHFLERRYKQRVLQIVNSNLTQAELGGVPGTFHIIKSYLRIKIPAGTQNLEDGDVDGQPVWPLIYYCLRCGDLTAAMQVATQARYQSFTHFACVFCISSHCRNRLDEFSGYLQEYIQTKDTGLPQSTLNKIRTHYRRSVHASRDPFKKAVYCVLGCCGVDDSHSEVAVKTDDYMWLRLSQVRQLDGGTSRGNQGEDILTLRKLQTILKDEYGEGHFQAFEMPLLFFFVLLLSLQFEAALQFLSRIERYRSHAVHFAIALYDAGLLFLPDSIQAPLLSKASNDTEFFNVAQLVIRYTRKFASTDPREAVEYFYLLKGLETVQGNCLFTQCLSDLVLETREFEMLLGRLEPDGSRKPGLVDKFGVNSSEIIETVASSAEAKGLAEDAVRLYDLAKKHDNVLRTLNKLLSQFLSAAPGAGQSTRNRLMTLGINIAERYKGKGHTATVSRVSTFYLLLDLMQFFNLYHQQLFDQALDVIQRLKVLPFRTEEVESKVTAFRQYTDEIRHNLPDILLATMNILHGQYRTAKAAAPSSPSLGIAANDGGRGEYLKDRRRQSRALITFAGMLPYRMPGDTSARLVQMEALMN
ncbi:nuclear pore complex protein Nup93-like isoform X2 [Corticium candelabrum]|uniref:nuclear pore complex protein Nup93-like isoform X2 n=1 Tax=Corticium candelabrum TaxID=121492 RepID=UPI002E264B50|nr:nuclear pore complex protein Nup93-like isoform X2 [Corticium candelabrum]